MTRPDESLIRDDDLKAKVAAERAKGTFPVLMDTLIRIQIEIQQERDAKAAEMAARQAMKPLARRRAKIGRAHV